MVVTACHVYRRHRHYGRDRFPAAEFISFSGDLDFAALDLGYGTRFTNSSQGARLLRNEGFAPFFTSSTSDHGRCCYS
jgi:hypothetical protein